MKRSLLIIFSVLIISFLGHSADAKDAIHVAVATNYIRPFQEIASIFESKTGIPVKATFASSGQLYAQIQSGAPYDVFFSADEELPESLYKQGVAEKPHVYATGKVVLWSLRKDLSNTGDWRKAVKMAEMKKIAIANPQTAPYGTAAFKALEKEGLKNIVGKKLVYAQNIAQAFQYASTGSVDAAFCAHSAAFTDEGLKGFFYTVDTALPVIQSACLLTRNKNRSGAEEFIRFLGSSETRSINLKYGYQ